MSRLSTDPALDPLVLDEDTVERLLAGDLPPDQAPPGSAGVAALLAATVAAPRPAELAGRAAPLAELKAATRTRQAPRGRRAGTPARRRRRVGLAVVVVVGALATGGAAAAASGRLPGPIRSILSTVGVTTPAPPTEPGRQPVPSTGSAGAGGQGGRAAGAAGPTAATSDVGAAREGLCQAFLAGQGKQQGKKMDAAAFKALADAAGGAGRITTYCQATQPGTGRPNEQTQPGPPDDNGQGQGGPPPSTGAGSQGQGGPPDTGPHSP